MERTQVLELMSTLKPLCMRNAYDGPSPKPGGQLLFHLISRLLRAWLDRLRITARSSKPAMAIPNRRYRWCPSRVSNVPGSIVAPKSL
ncbi:hypothetical protein [Ensifer aridi]|uniref:hypothetical protein n=1 Tax=Ensifer aridi TaxID=1708715 RepID=UPI00111C4CA6|nr:hypothetical protein [Ensifer aridi]